MIDDEPELDIRRLLRIRELAIDLAEFLDRNDDECYADERHDLLARSRDEGLLS